MLGLAIDITERKTMEKKLLEAKLQAEEVNRAKSNFIANISHDLRTPLHTVLGTAELLKLKKHLPEQEEHIEAILQSGEILLQLVENVLGFSKLEQGEVETVQEAFNLKAIIDDVLILLNKPTNQKPLEIITHYDPSTPHNIISDSNALRRILINLVGNASKFTDQGKIIISVEATQIDALHANFTLSVKDTGIGIPKNELKRIFDRFYRIDPSYKGKYKGNGLGLAITHKLVNHLKGSIKVKSKLGVGTEFICYFKFKLDHQSNLNSQRKSVSIHFLGYQCRYL